jgi:hypothetical protein
MKSIPSRPAGKGLERARAAANCEGGQSGSGRSVSEAAKTGHFRPPAKSLSERVRCEALPEAVRHS